MKKLTFLFLLLLSINFVTAQKITQGEYFWNADPGIGNGTPLLALDGNFDTALEELFKTGVSVSGLNIGAHTFNLRVKGQDGTWSNPFKQIIYVQGPLTTITRATKVSQGEYFWNTDPGTGNGTPLLALDGNFDTALEELFKTGVDVSSLNIGAHTFNVRVKGQDGTWSNPFKQTIYVQGPLTTITRVTKITQGEYFWNTDPGVGNGTPMLALDGNFDIALEELFKTGVDVSSLNIGAHTFNVRVKGQDGTWSNPFKQIIYVQGPLTTITRVTKVSQGEYFWNTDPGTGNGTPLLALDGNFDTALEDLFENGISTTGLAGANSFVVRIKGQDGTWSNPFKQTIFINCTAPVASSVSIAASNDTVCIGTSIIYTATPINGGSNPSFVWQKNGIVVGTDSSIYDNPAPANNDVVLCVLTSNSTCTTNATATSNSITIKVNQPSTYTFSYAICQGTSYFFNGINRTTSGVYKDTLINAKGCDSIITLNLSVNPVLVPSISISSNTGASICAGTSVTFTATPTNGGNTPTYQWQKNGVNVGTGLTTYTTSNLANNDTITCILTSSITCVSTTKDTSNAIVLTVVSTNITPSVSINVSPNDTITAGTSVTFTATPINGGNNPSYQWKVNGVNVGSNNSTYTSSNLTNNSVVTCTLTSNLACVQQTTATSNGITVVVISVSTISISTPSISVCSGQQAVFTASTTNATNATYQWKKNGINVGTGLVTYSPSNLATGDVISCVMTVNGNTYTSNSITMTVSTNLTAIISIMATPGEIVCAGTSVTFIATPTNGGNNPIYQWQKNGVNVGTGLSTYTTSNLANNDVITCVLTSNLACIANASSNSIAMTVNPLPATPIITANGNVLSSSSATGNQWYLNGNPIAGANGQTHTASQNGNYTVLVTNNCGSTLSSAVIVNATDINETTSNSFSIFPNPSTGIFNIELSETENYSIKVFNILGQEVMNGDNIKSIELSSQNKGIYFIEIKTAKQTITKRIVLE